LEAALERAMRTAKERQCDLVLIAGDLFESPRPSERLLQQTMRVLASLGRPVCIIPGTHDLKQGRSPYAVSDWRARCANVRLLLSAEPTRVEFPEFGVVVHGGAAPRGESPLRGLKRDERFRWNIALAHGGLLGELVTDEGQPIEREKIAASGMDYVALGHWHGWRQWAEGPTVACYPGALEPMAFDQKNTGCAALVTLAESVTVEQVRVGSAWGGALELKVDGFASADDLAQAIAARADAELLLQVTLSGLLPEGWSLNAGDMAQACGAGLAALEVIDLVERWVPEERATAQEGIAAMLRQEAQRLMNEASEEEQRRRIGEALRLGLAALQGLEVV
jgi:DNA repair exonuclease SbcCD nuclease subunit